MSSSKRLFDVITEKLPSLLIESSPEQVEQLISDIIEANAKKKQYTEDERIESQIGALEKKYSLIQYGSSWKSEKTYEAVSQLKELDFDTIVNALLSLDDVELQWKLAVRFTEAASSIIDDASENADKLVNGSAGEWCPETASVVVSLWEGLMKAAKKPSDALFEETEGRIGYLLGDYGELDFVKR